MQKLRMMNVSTTIKADGNGREAKGQSDDGPYYTDGDSALSAHDSSSNVHFLPCHELDQNSTLHCGWERKPLTSVERLNADYLEHL